MKIVGNITKIDLNDKATWPTKETGRKVVEAIIKSKDDSVGVYPVSGQFMHREDDFWFSTESLDIFKEEIVGWVESWDIEE